MASEGDGKMSDAQNQSERTGEVVVKTTASAKVSQGDEIRTEKSASDSPRTVPVPIGAGGRGRGRAPHHQYSSHGSQYSRGGGRGYQHSPRGGGRRYGGESPPTRGGRYSPHSPGRMSHMTSGGFASQSHPSSRFSGAPVQVYGVQNPQNGMGHQHGSSFVRPAAVSTPPPPPPPTRSAAQSMIVPNGWQYQDPEGDVHGPYLAAKIVNWVDKGFFSEGLPVRKVTSEGMGAWTTLKVVLMDIRREAALTVVPVSEAEQPTAAPAVQEQVAEKQASFTSVIRRPPPPPAKDSGSSPMPPKETAVKPSEPQRAMERQGSNLHKGDGQRTRESVGDTWGRSDSRSSNNRFGDRWNSSNDMNQSRPARGRGGDRGGRGGRGQDRGGRSRGGRSGRGGRGRGGPSVDPDVADAVHKLFTGEVDQGAEQPMWRYIDYEGNTQGPFPAKSMIEWFEGGYLADSAIPVCGTERKVSPPNLPPPEFYIPLGALIFWIRRGNHFKSITVADIQGKTLPEDLASLKESAAKAFEDVNKEKETAASKLAAKQSSIREKPAESPLHDRPSSIIKSDISWAEVDDTDAIPLQGLTDLASTAESKPSPEDTAVEPVEESLAKLEVDDGVNAST